VPGVQKERRVVAVVEEHAEAVVGVAWTGFVVEGSHDVARLGEDESCASYQEGWAVARSAVVLEHQHVVTFFAQACVVVEPGEASVASGSAFA
jgi:hypothetical protein